jgi:hypothetical protein
VLVKIGRLGEFGQALALASVRRQEKHLAIAALNISGKDGGPALAANRLRKDEKPLVEIEAEILFDQAEIADPIALGGIEAAGAKEPDNILAVARA